MTQAAECVEISVEIDYSKLRRRLAMVASRETAFKLNKHVGNVVLELVKDHLDKMSISRHKTADRLGAAHSKFYEYASGRVAGSPRGQTTELENVTEKGSVISIKNTPGLSRAYHDLVITPKRASALTIPVDRIAYNKRVKDLRNDGHDVFRPRGTNILAEKRGEGKESRLRPLYVLVRKAVVPKDDGLLPTNKELREYLSLQPRDLHLRRLRDCAAGEGTVVDRYR